eukprot:403374458
MEQFRAVIKHSFDNYTIINPPPISQIMNNDSNFNSQEGNTSTNISIVSKDVNQSQKESKPLQNQDEVVEHLNRKRKAESQVFDLEDYCLGSKRQKLNQSQVFSKLRQGGLRFGDTPKKLLKIILMEGEAFWEIEWEQNYDKQNMLNGGNLGHDFMNESISNSLNVEVIEDSYERQTNLLAWDKERFYALKQQYIQTKSKTISKFE